MRLRLSGLWVLSAVVLVTTAVKIALVLSGPEIDPDAFAHAMAGRRLLLAPTDVTIHWVWLPFWHLVHAGCVALGGGLLYARMLNVLLSAAAPFLLVHLLLPRDPQRRFAWLAGLALALDPLSFALSVTGQSELALQVLLLAACASWQRPDRAGLVTGLFLSLAVMTRYEAWVTPVVWWLLWWRGRRGSSLAWLLPLATIALWCVLHLAATGEPLQFLRHGGDFARGYLDGVGYPWGREPLYPLMLVWYLVAVPVLTYGPFALLWPLALRGLSKRVPPSLLGCELAVMAFLTVGWIARRHLGLSRHGVSLSPLYAVLLAAGALRAVELAGRRRPMKTAVAGAALVAALAVASIARSYLELRERHRTAYALHARVARALRAEVAAGERIFCDVGPVEVLSNLPPEAFTRWQLRDVSAFHLRHASKSGRSAWVVSSRERVKHLLRDTAVRFRAGDLVVLRYRR